MTLYNAEHFFHPNDLKRYSLGTKNKNLRRTDDGSLSLYVGSQSPGPENETNWVPAPAGHFSLYMRAYWGQQAITSTAPGSPRQSWPSSQGRLSTVPAELGTTPPTAPGEVRGLTAPPHVRRVLANRVRRPTRHR